MSHDRKQDLKIAALFVAVLALAGAVVLIALRSDRESPLAAVGSDGPRQFFGGCIVDPAAREALQAKLPEKWFEDTPAFRAFRGRETGVVLHSDAVKGFLGEHIPARDQGDVGSCVSFGTASAVEYLICIQAFSQFPQPPPSVYQPLVQEAIYALSRVEIGGGTIRGDGSVTTWAGRAVKEYGVIPRGTYGSLNLSIYSETRCRDWGKRGLPDNLEPVARQSPVKGITFARSAREVDKALRSGYTVAVGSDVGFGNRGPWERDKDGFLKASGSWGHCMAVVGVVDGPRPGFLFLNSWGANWVRGPTGGYDIPPGSFWVDWRTADRMFAEGDCVIFSDAEGFPARDPWFI